MDEDEDDLLFDEAELPDEVLDGDLEKLITQAESEAAQKTEAFMRKQSGTESMFAEVPPPAPRTVPADDAAKKKIPAI